MKHKRQRHKQHHDPTQQASPAYRAQRLIQLDPKERERPGRHVARKGIACEGTGCEGPVRIDEVRQDGRVGEYDAHAKARASDDGHDPVHVRERSESHDDEPDGARDGGDFAHRQAGFGRGDAACGGGCTAVLAVQSALPILCTASAPCWSLKNV